MTDKAEADERYVLFEFLDRNTVTFRRSDMEFPDVRRQFLDLVLYLLGAELPARFWELELGRVPEEWGDFLALRVVVHSKGKASADLFKAGREPGVDAGENPIITSIRKTCTQ